MSSMTGQGNIRMKTLYNVLGGVTTPEQGIIKEREDYYMARGYSRNDRVGKVI